MSLRRAGVVTVVAGSVLCGIGWLLSAPLTRAEEERLWQYRNLGKAFYENPTTQKQAVEEFRKARELGPRLAAPHFQLYGLYRQLERTADAARELAVFQELKKSQEGAAVPEDMEWSVYSEIYDAPPEAAGAPIAAAVYRDRKVADG